MAYVTFFVNENYVSCVCVCVCVWGHQELIKQIHILVLYHINNWKQTL